MITQICIMIFGASAIWFVGRKEKWKRWGYILGLLGQPFWIYESYTNEQWGILIMCLFYAYSWIQGIINYWLVDDQETDVPNFKDCPPPPDTFQPIPDYEKRYSVSYYGKIKNNKTNRFLKTRILDNGLERINLFDGKTAKTFYIHRLVIAAFLEPLDFNVKHIDGNKLNNRLDNLEYDFKGHFISQDNSVGQKEVINKETGESFESIKTASESLKINYANLSAMLSGKILNRTSLCLKK